MHRCIAVSLLLIGHAVTAQAQVIPDSVIAGLTSESEVVRARSFFMLADLAAPRGIAVTDSLAALGRRNDDVARGLIELLRLDGSRATSVTPASLRSAHVFTYLAELTGAVARLRDPRALDALLSVIAAGELATDGLAALGDTAVVSVIAATTAPTREVRVAAWQTVAKLLSGDALTRQSHRDALLKLVRDGLFDASAEVRAAALFAVPTRVPAELMAAVQAMAERDPHAVTRDGVETFPLRTAARRRLDLPDRP